MITDTLQEVVCRDLYLLVMQLYLFVPTNHQEIGFFFFFFFGFKDGYIINKMLIFLEWRGFSYIFQSICCLLMELLTTMCKFVLASEQFNYQLIEVKWGLVGGLLVYISMGRCRCFIRSMWVIGIIIRLLWHTKVSCWPGWGPVWFIREIRCMNCSKSSRIHCRVRWCNLLWFS